MPPTPPARESLKTARARLSTNRLLRASAELIGERGYDRTTLAAIGARAGYSHGLVTRRFGSKDGLLEALLHKMISEWHEREVAPLLAKSSGAASLHVIVDGIRMSAKRDAPALRALYTLMFEGLKPAPRGLHERMQAVHRNQRSLIAETVARGLADGSIAAGADPEAAALLIAGALRGAAYQWLLDDEFDFDRALGALAAHMRQTLTTRPGQTPVEVPG
ncbi:MAG: TetR/AcrR family transcriptional regulator [Chloroflexi bacterium]|nr:TetR/AcrR family transcriptional regulator [Chloroflexota bacterium]